MSRLRKQAKGNVFVCAALALALPSEVLAQDDKTPQEEKTPRELAVCREMTAQIIEATSAEFSEIAPDGNVRLKHWALKEITLACPPFDLRVSLDFAGPYPPNEWFESAAQAGSALTGVAQDKMETALRKCHLMALEGKLDKLVIPGAHIECEAFDRDGGHVGIDIYPPDPADDEECRTLDNKPCK